ncbi:MAG: hypothetical protein D6796_16025 [Caldilineae bacterium]|nr:MAG: hypothetical protein D6796_16025 [Caldilineae bacterium]
MTTFGNAGRALWRAVGLLALLALFVTPAEAHGGVEAGPYEVTLGWVTEPPLLGQPNAVYLRVLRHETGEAVQVGGGLAVAVEAGNQVRQLSLHSLDTPGEYAAPFIPTVRGVYTVRLTGQIEDQPVNVTQEIEAVETAEAYQFPATMPTLPQLHRQLTTLQTENAALRTAASLNRWLAIAGLGLGLAGLGMAWWGGRKGRS